jgi:hypothetical protein
MTAYNWENNASNAGSDYRNQNDAYLGGGDTPNGAVAPGLEAARAAGAAMIVTLPIIGYVAADKNADGDVAGTAAAPVPNYLGTRFRQSPARKGGAFTLAPDTTDAFVYQDEYVNFLDKTYAGAFAAADKPIFISLDNEPDLWQHTHARLRGDSTTYDTSLQNGANATYAEMVQRTTDYADAAKDVNPAALIFGPVNYGWQGMTRFQDAADDNDRDFLEFYLQEMKAAETTTGHRLVDVLDVHWYPEARGACGVRRLVYRRHGAVGRVSAAEVGVVLVPVVAARIAGVVLPVVGRHAVAAGARQRQILRPARGVPAVHAVDEARDGTQVLRAVDGEVHLHGRRRRHREGRARRLGDAGGGEAQLVVGTGERHAEIAEGGDPGRGRHRGGAGELRAGGTAGQGGGHDGGVVSGVGGVVAADLHHGLGRELRGLHRGHRLRGHEQRLLRRRCRCGGG